jgi:hypothetical protein
MPTETPGRAKYLFPITDHTILLMALATRRQGSENQGVELPVGFGGQDQPKWSTIHFLELTRLQRSRRREDTPFHEVPKGFLEVSRQGSISSGGGVK